MSVEASRTKAFFKPGVLCLFVFMILAVFGLSVDAAERHDLPLTVPTASTREQGNIDAGVRTDERELIEMHGWIAGSEMGECPDNYYLNNTYYVCYEIYDPETGEPYSNYASEPYTVTVTLYAPDGRELYAATHNGTDWGWISYPFNETGFYSATVILEGEIYLRIDLGVAPTQNIDTYTKYTITYFDNYSSDCPPAQTKYHNRDLVLSSVTPTRIAHKFLGWSSDYEATVPEYYPGGKYTLDQSITLYAVWETNYTVVQRNSHFIANINTAGDTVYFRVRFDEFRLYEIFSDTLSLDSCVYLYDILGNPIGYDNDSGEGKNFRYRDLFSLNTCYIGVKLVDPNATGSVSVYVGDIYEIDLDANGGSVSPSVIFKNYWETIYLPTPKHKSLIFVAWAHADDMDRRHGPDNAYTVNGEQRLVAVWGDSDRPTADISCTNDTAVKQTVTISMYDASGISGYHWFTHDADVPHHYRDVGTISHTAKIDVTLPGTYHLYIYDVNGVISEDYTVTFRQLNLYAKNGTVDIPYIIAMEGNEVSLPAAQRSGYTFTGWLFELNPMNATPFNTITAKADYDLYAQWNRGARPTVTLYSTNDTAAKQTVLATVEDDYGVNGYYWCSSPELDNNYYFKYKWELGEIITVDDVYSPGTYYFAVKDIDGNFSETASITFHRITLDPNGGSVSRTELLSVEGREMRLPMPERDGYSFAGWARSASASSGYMAITVYSGETLYAIWKPVDAKPTAVITVSNNTATYQSIIIDMSDDIGIAGYYWGTSADYSANTYTPTSSRTVIKKIGTAGTYYFTAKDTSGNLSVTYSIVFCKTTLDARGGSVSPSYIITKSGNSITLPTPEKNDYRFGGWAESNTANSGVTSVTVSSNRTYYAIWIDEAAPMAVYESTNNIAASQTLSVTMSDNEGIAGYYWGTSGSYYWNNYVEVTSDTVTIPITESGTYYLTVKDTSGNLSESYPIIFCKTVLDGNGGTVTPSYIITNYGKTITLPKAVREGYRFKGWGSSKDSVSWLTSLTVIGERYYYALWSEDSAPRATLSSTNNTATTQTLTISMSDDEGVSGYYWGTGSNYSDNEYTEASSGTVKKTISESGIYYLTVKDVRGNLSQTYSITFCRIELEEWYSSVDPEYIIAEKETTIVLPTPEAREGFRFEGWRYNGAILMKIAPETDISCYSMWKDIEAPWARYTSSERMEAAQTLSIKLVDNWNIEGYYFGTDSNVSENPFTESDAQRSVRIEIDTADTYYLMIVDESGNLSPIYTIKYCLITLDAQGGTVEPEQILMLEGTELTLPTPQKRYGKFLGWAASPDEASGTDKITVKYSRTYYALWELIIYPLTLELESDLDKKVYYIGDSLDTTGLKLISRYTDGHVGDVTKYCEISGFDSSTAGVKTVRFFYYHYYVYIDVTVKEPKVTVCDDISVMTEETDAVISAVTEPSGQSAEWYSSDRSVAEVLDGRIYAYRSGKVTVTARMTYNGIAYEDSIEITVVSPVLDHIRIHTLPAKMIYEIGELLDTTGLKLTLVYNNGKTKNTTKGFTVIGFDSDSSGIKTLTVNYEGKTVTFDVTVNEAKVIGAELVSTPLKTVYYIGDSPDTDGIEIKLIFNDGSSRIISSGFRISGFDSMSEGTKTVTVSVDSYSDSFDITVKTPSIVISVSEITLTELESAILEAVCDPQGVKVNWSSSYASVATVENGNITALKSGKTVITASFTYNGITYSAKCKVNVIKPVAVSVGIEAIPLKTVYYIGDTFDALGIRVKVNYNNGEERIIDEGFEIGGFDSMTEGTKTVTVSVGSCSDSFDVTVKTPSIVVSVSEITLTELESAILEAVCDPQGVKVSWSSSYASVATVENGNITAVKSGATRITASFTYNGIIYSAVCKVNVEASVKEAFIKASVTKTEYYIGEEFDSADMVVTLYYTDNTSRIITDGYCVSGFDSTTEGLKRICVKYNEFEDHIEVRVLKLPRRAVSVSIFSEPDKLDYYIGDMLDTTGLRLVVYYDDESSEIIENGFTVSSGSTEREGKNKVTVNYNGLSDDYMINVYCPSITLSHSEYTMNTDDSFTLTATTLPSDVTVVWSVDFPDRISVDNGRIIALDKGKAKVCASFVYNSTEYKAFCEITVKVFDDVDPDSWMEEAIYYCKDNEYMGGTGDGMFSPDKSLTREQFVVILARVECADLSLYTKSPFKDVKSSSWYGPSVIWAYEMGYVYGINDGTNFGVGMDITREQIATMFYRYAEKKGCDMSGRAELKVFEDYAKIGSWARESCSWAVDSGLIGSTNTAKKVLSPKMKVTRAQAAKIFMSFDINVLGK